MLLKHSTRVSGLTDLTVTLLDVLDELDEIKIATKYVLDGKEIDYIPGSNDQYERCIPQYITMKG